MRRRLEVLLLVAVLAATLAAALALVTARFARGDAFPAGSSLSTAPRGTRAFADSLARLPGVEVGRALRPTEIEDCAEGCTLMLLGVSTWQLLDVETLERIDHRLRAGARVVVAFAPVERRGECGACGGGEETGGDSDGEEAIAEPEEPEAAKFRRPAPAWWRELELEFEPLPESDGRLLAALLVPAPGAAAEQVERLAWRSGTVFSRLPTGAQPIWMRGDRPVAAELQVGRGRLLVASDRTPFTNQALRDERATGALLVLLGEPRRVLFEETHLGVVRSGGLMVLARRYRLTGALAALLALALLWVWRVASPLAPLGAEVASASRARGPEATAGLIGLYRRGIPPRALLAACLDSWRGSPAGRVAAGRAHELATLAATARDPVAGYEAIRNQLALPEN